MKKTIIYFKKLLSMSYGEAKGFLSLLVVCIIAVTLIFFSKTITRSPQDIDQRDIEKLDSLVVVLENAQLHDGQGELFAFNPNSVSVDSLVLLGFPEKLAQRLDNYRAKGGRFYIKEDVKKIYGISEQLYISVMPYINLPDSILPVRGDMLNFDLNEVTVVELKAIKGIGDFLANRIIKYRELLGGFISKDQLDEVYQLEEDALNSIKNHSFVRKDFQPDKLRINDAIKKDLMRHPYITIQLAEDIIRFREINGAIESEKLLASFKSVDKSNFERLISYLEFQ